MKWLPWCALALAGVNICAAGELTLEEAIRQALASNRTIHNAAIEIEKASEARESQRTRLFPDVRLYALAAQPLESFSFTVSQGSLGTDSAGAPIPAHDSRFQNSAGPIGVIAVSVAEPLSQIPSIRRGVRLAEIARELSQEQLRLERQKLVRDVKTLYYGIQSLDGALRAVREGVRVSQEIVRLTSEYASKRQVLDVDYLEAQMHLARFNENLLDLDNKRETLKTRLNQLIGRDILTDFTVSALSESADIQTIAESGPADAAERAAAQRPEIRQARLKVEQEKLEMSNAAAGYNPSVAAEFIGVDLVNVTSFLPRRIGVAGVSATWEPFTWGRRRHDLLSRHYAIDQAANLENDIAGRIRVEAMEQFRRVQLGAAKLRVANLTRQMATESLRISQKQYEAEYTLLRTVLQSQASLENADADYAQSLSELWAARAEYDRSLGQDQ